MKSAATSEIGVRAVTDRTEKMLDARERRRLASEGRFLAREEAREAAAERMIGMLADGRLYIWPIGGRYREGTRADLIAFLKRNRYV